MTSCDYWLRTQYPYRLALGTSSRSESGCASASAFSRDPFVADHDQREEELQGHARQEEAEGHEQREATGAARVPALFRWGRNGYLPINICSNLCR